MLANMTQSWNILLKVKIRHIHAYPSDCLNRANVNSLLYITNTIYIVYLQLKALLPLIIGLKFLRFAAFCTYFMLGVRRR